MLAVFLTVRETAFINQQFYVPLSIQTRLVTTSNPKQKSTKFLESVIIHASQFLKLEN